MKQKADVKDSAVVILERAMAETGFTLYDLHHNLMWSYDEIFGIMRGDFILEDADRARIAKVLNLPSLDDPRISLDATRKRHPVSSYFEFVKSDLILDRLDLQRYERDVEKLVKGALKNKEAVLVSRHTIAIDDRRWPRRALVSWTERYIDLVRHHVLPVSDTVMDGIARLFDLPSASPYLHSAKVLLAYEDVVAEQHTVQHYRKELAQAEEMLLQRRIRLNNIIANPKNSS